MKDNKEICDFCSETTDQLYEMYDEDSNEHLLVCEECYTLK